MSHEMPRTAPEAVADAIDTLIRHLGTATAAPPRIASTTHPDQPGRTTFVLTGATRASVQAGITGLMEGADRFPGCSEAHFLPPYLVGRGTWGSVGEVLVR